MFSPQLAPLADQSEWHEVHYGGRRCRHRNLTGRGRCRRPIIDPAAADCGRHLDANQERLSIPIRTEAGCLMVQEHPGVWVCRTHAPEQWEVGQALGAELPCRIPLHREELKRLANSKPLAPQTAMLLALQLEFNETLAQNPTCSAEALRHIAEYCIAQWNGVTRPLQQLLDWLVRARNIPTDALYRLWQHDMTGPWDSGVLRNRNCPHEILQQAVQKGQPNDRLRVALNEGTPEYILRQLARSDDPPIVGAVADNDACPPGLLHELCAHPNARVAQAARQHIIDRGHVAVS